jgi:hypothetical protein
VEAQKAYSDEWKGLVRMMKKWNAQRDKPIKPSFLIEVMALQVLLPPWGGDYRREMQAFFASIGTGFMRRGRTRLVWGRPSATRQAAEAIRLERDGKLGDALRAWRTLFGPLFPVG